MTCSPVVPILMSRLQLMFPTEAITMRTWVETGRVKAGSLQIQTFPPGTTGMGTLEWEVKEKVIVILTGPELVTAIRTNGQNSLLETILTTQIDRVIIVETGTTRM